MSGLNFTLSDVTLFLPDNSGYIIDGYIIYSGLIIDVPLDSKYAYVE